MSARPEIDHSGFEDLAEAKSLMADWAAQRASVVRRQIAEILDILDQRVERRLQQAEIGHVPSLHDSGSYIKRALRRAGLFLIRVSQEHHQHAPESVDLDLEKIEAVINLPKSIGIVRHRVFSQAVGSPEASEADQSGHRLSGGAQ